MAYHRFNDLSVVHLEESSPDVSYPPDAPEEISSKYHKECVHLLAGCLLH